MRLLLLPALFAIVLLGTGCSSPNKSLANMQKSLQAENSRTTEQRRMHAMTADDANSTRGSEVVVWDPDKTFDPTHSVIGSNKTFASQVAQQKTFYFDQKAKPTTYGTQNYGGAKGNSAADKKFDATAANTKGKYAIPGVDQPAKVKTANVKDATESGKLATTRELWDARRPYLGQESAKMSNAVDQTKDVGWSGEMKPMTIDDIRDLLNKSK